MSGTGYYGRNQIIDGDVRTDNAFSNMNSEEEKIRNKYVYWALISWEK